MPDAVPLLLFTFRVNGEDAEVPRYGCTAPTLQVAIAKAAAAGHHDVTLEESRELTAAERSSAASRRIADDPLLGSEWLPLVDAIEHVTTLLETGRFWTLSTYSALAGFDPHRSPWAQAMLEADGSLHLETRPAPELDEQHYATLAFLDWTDPRLEGGAPVPWRILEPGWNGRRVAEVIIEALVVAGGVTATDFVNFGERVMENVDRLGVLKRVDDGPIFHLPDPAPHPLVAVVAEFVGHQRETGQPLRYSAYLLWARANERPDGRTVRDHFGGWGDALRAVGAQPPGVDDTAEALARFEQLEGIGPAFVPAQFAGALVALNPGNFGTAAYALRPLDLYLDQPAVEYVRAGNWDDLLAFGVDGHGMNSYAYSYLLVTERLVVNGQVFRGLLNWNRERSAAAWSAMMTGIEAIHAAAQLIELDEDQRLHLHWNTLRHHASLAILDRALAQTTELVAVDLDAAPVDDDGAAFFNLCVEVIGRLEL